jgi:hypothetical protein
VRRDDVRNDPIIKFKQIVGLNEIAYGCALRQSGKVDLYWNYTLTNSPDGNLFHFLMIDVYREILRYRS